MHCHTYPPLRNTIVCVNSTGKAGELQLLEIDWRRVELLVRISTLYICYAYTFTLDDPYLQYYK